MMPHLLAETEVFSVSQAGQWFLGLLAVVIIADRFLSVAVNCQSLFGKKDDFVKQDELERAIANLAESAEQRQNENRRRLRRIEEGMDELVSHLLGKPPRSLSRRLDEEDDTDAALR